MMRFSQFPYKRKTKMLYSNVAIHADDGFAHDVAHGVGDLKGVMNKHKFSFAFTLGVNNQVAVTEDSAAQRLVNQ